MSEGTSIGPGDDNTSGKTEPVSAPQVEVDAQQANENDMRKGLAGAETQLPKHPTDHSYESSDTHFPRAAQPTARDDNRAEPPYRDVIGGIGHTAGPKSRGA